jgi:phosphohistidine swiveling domain-containing protein
MTKTPQYNFVKVWTTEYSYLSLFAFVEGYTTKSKELVGMGFKNIIFKFEKGLATIYRVNEEIYNLSNFYAQRSVDDIAYLKTSILKAYQISAEIINLAKQDSAFKNISDFRKFRSLLIQFLPYYLVFIWTTDGIKNLGYTGKLKLEIERLCLEARHKTEKFYPDLEKLISKHLSELISEKEINYLGLVLTADEIEEFILNKNLPPASILKARYTHSVIKYMDRGPVIEVGRIAKSTINKIENWDLNISEFKGVVAMKGKITGLVKIIFRDEDASKFNSGDILVTTMTRPDWLPIMKKSSAYITDAGGMLCHAAIVARELGKPCIIGTKIATKVLKDGDMVEVDAENGVVKILKHA